MSTITCMSGYWSLGSAPNRGFVTLNHLGSHPWKLFRKGQALSKSEPSINSSLSWANVSQSHQTGGERWHQSSQLMDQTFAETRRKKSDNIFSMEKSLQCRSLVCLQWITLQFRYDWCHRGSYANLTLSVVTEILNCVLISSYNGYRFHSCCQWCNCCHSHS